MNTHTGQLYDVENAINKLAMSEKSLSKIRVQFTEPKQQRSKQAIDNLIEAAEMLVDSGNSSKFSARELAKASGYSLGALVQRLGKVENVFLHAIAYSRERHLQAIGTQLKAFAGEIDVASFAEYLVTTALHTMQNIVGPSVMRYYENRALGRVSTVEDLHSYTDETVPVLMELVALDKTGTFREMTPFEYKYVVRSIFHVLERPFIESHPDAGSEEHRQMAIRFVTSLLSK